MELPKPIEMLNLADRIETDGQDYQPKRFDEYLGQTELKNKLSLYAKAAELRNEALDHILLFGPPGLGKTTLAQIIASELKVGIKICTGPMLERTGDLVAILSSLEHKEVLFIDEIHRLSTNVEEVLYSAMEQFKVDVIIGQGVGAKSVSLPLNPFTLIGATTKTGLISAPLRTRFSITERLDFYSYEELSKIIIQSSKHLNISLTETAALTIAKAARGTPRIAKKILRRIRDFAQINNNNIADDQLVKSALEFLKIDQEGLTSVDNMILKTMVMSFDGGPVGLETLAAMVGEDSETIENVYEPYLMRQGYIEKTARGRQIPYKTLPYLKNRFLDQKSII